MFSLSENRLKLGSFLVSFGRSVYIFAALNLTDFLQLQFSVLESSGDICCFECLGVLNFCEIIVIASLEPFEIVKSNRSSRQGHWMPQTSGQALIFFLRGVLYVIKV